ncbi:MAG: recombinase family protein [Firmicutes bacterium]|nr:recombinase family protein [Bacillota bacterium]
MRALIYTRVSTAGQKDGYSLESQKIACQKKAKELKAEEVIYLEDTYSGIELERPALTQLRELVLRGKVDAVICLDPDRLSRNLADLLLITNELDRLNVELVFVNFTWESTPLGRLFLEMRGAIAEFEHALIRERTLRGKRQKAAEGGLPSFVEPYGYRFNSKEDCLNIIKKEAEVVSFIFGEYNKGFDSGRSLADKLNRQKIMAPSGTTWHASTVLRILSNRTYLGILVVGGVPIKVPAIISEGEFNQAQEVKALNKKQAIRKTKKNYLLQNLVTCGLCGATLKISAHSVREKSYSYYVCPLRRQKECNLKPYATDKIDNLVWNEFMQRFRNAAPSFVEYGKNQAKQRLSDLLQTKITELGNIKNREKKLLELVVSDVIDSDAYREEQLSVEHRKKVLLAEISNLNEQDESLFKLDLEVPKRYQKKTLEIFTEKIVITDQDEILIYTLI